LAYINTATKRSDQGHALCRCILLLIETCILILIQVSEGKEIIQVVSQCPRSCVFS